MTESVEGEGSGSPVAAGQLYELVFEQAPVGVFTYDRGLVVREVNASFCRILESTEQRLVGLDMHVLRDQRVLPALEAVLAGETRVYEGPYYATTSAALIWIRMQAAPIHGEDGSVVGGVGIVEDVTARKRSESVREMMLELSEAAHTADDLSHIYLAIHSILGRRMPAENLYFALWDEGARTVEFPYFVDRFDPPPAPQKARRGLTEMVLFGGRTVLADRAQLQAMADSGEVEIGGSLPASWLGVPLAADGKPIGVLVLQSYDDRVTFDEDDASLLGFVAEQVAMAIVRKRHEEEIERLARFDPLTGLHNRRTLQERAPEILSLAERKGWEVALLYLDLDRFKAVNDTLGHDAGDELLQEVAVELQTTRRRSDLLARIGGDEFALVLPDADAETAARTARRLLALFDRRFEVRGHPVHLGGSLGIAVYPRHGRTLEELLKHADIAMYRAKEDEIGWAIYDEASSPFSRVRLRREAGLREAIDGDELHLVYQPIRDLRSGGLVAWEGLVRWTVGDELRPASEFVPLAEQSGLIRRLDRHVLRRALLETAAAPNVAVAVNLSARTIRAPGFLEYVRTVLHETGFDPHRLILEVTESVVIAAFEEPARILGELRDLGLGIAIDDFGSGFASLTYLRHLPCDRLKIDKSLVAELGSDRRSEAMVRAIVELGHGLDLRVLAEGVEKVSQLQWLAEAGADEVQGYAIGAPAPFETVRAEVASRARA